MVKLAFSKSASTGLGWFVRTFERGAYSHVELVFSDGVSYSCVANEGPKRFGVRRAIIAYDDSWVMVPIPEIHPMHEALLRAYCDGMVGKPYDVVSLLGYVFKGGKVFPNAFICSEFVQDALAYIGCWYASRNTFLSPSRLYELVTTHNPLA